MAVNIRFFRARAGVNMHASQVLSLVRGLCGLASAPDDTGMRHRVDLDVQDLSGISKLHNHSQLVGLLIEGDQLHATLKHIQYPAG